MKGLAQTLWTNTPICDRMNLFPTLPPFVIGADWEELDEIAKDTVREYVLTDQTTFLCLGCGRVLRTIHMGRFEGICDSCEGKADEGEERL